MSHVTMNFEDSVVSFPALFDCLNCNVLCVCVCVSLWRGETMRDW